MKAEVLAALTDLFFGFAALVFASAILGRGGTAITRKLTSVLSTEQATKLNKAISESDFLKEGFKGIGKIATTKMKLNPSALFGESEADAFANQLNFQFHVGVQALTDAISSKKLTDDQLISTFLAYDVEYTNVFAYRQTLKTLFRHFQSFVHPIGTETAPTEVSAVDTYTRAVWVVLLEEANGSTWKEKLLRLFLGPPARPSRWTERKCRRTSSSLSSRKRGRSLAKWKRSSRCPKSCESRRKSRRSVPNRSSRQSTNRL